MEKKHLIKEIQLLTKKKNAVILGHYYQIPEIQDISDFIGDSLALSQKAANTQADIIVFAGVHFMAETAKILNPTKKVLLPDLNAACSLADACQFADLKQFKALHPDHKVISYINCSAEVKTLSDLICTSGNALKLVEQFPKDEKIIFAPDKNLGAYINRITGRNMLLWDGSCHIHDQLTDQQLLRIKEKYPNAKMIAHPECNPAVLLLADFVGSTAAMLNFIQKDSSQSYIVATETGIAHQMQKLCPTKTFYIATMDESCACNDCPYMKLNTLEKLYACLLNETPEIQLPTDIMDQARKPIEAMLARS
ncbi:MAG: quinolinate synthase NadA [Bacteroidales bacterium]